jgi:hypothetical protein
MVDVTFEGCIYEGGFQGMAAHDKAKLTLTDTEFALKRPRAFQRTLLKVWARWTAVKQFEVESSEAGGVVVTITTGKIGPGTIRVPAVTPMDIWSKMSTVEVFRPHIPADVCVELGLEPSPTPAGTAADSEDSESSSD